MSNLPFSSWFLSVLFPFIALFFPGAAAKAQLKYGVELLKNTDFEVGNSIGWTNRVKTSPVVDFYGNPKTTWGPSFQEAQKMKGPPGWGGKAGGNYYLRNSYLVQVFSLSGNSKDIDAGKLSIRLKGYMGGGASTNSWAELKAIFFDGQNRHLKTYAIGSDTTAVKRNFVARLLLREGTFPVPPSARKMEIQANCWAADRFMDNLSCRLILNWKIPPLPLGPNLIVNGSFETKELTGQPWDGWELFGSTRVGLYGTPNFPGLSYLLAMRKVKKDPGNYLCLLSSPIVQTFDLRGNAAGVDAGQLEFFLQARLLSKTYSAGSVDLEFFNTLGAVIQKKTLSTWHLSNTSNRVIPLPWVQKIQVPPFSRRMKLTFNRRHWLDKVSLVLQKKTTPSPTPLGVNLIRGGDFEGQDWLDFTSDSLERAWVGGAGDPYFRPVIGVYGIAPSPPQSHARTILGGKQLLRTNGGDPTRPTYGYGIISDLRIHGRDLLIDNGLLRIHFEGYFGGAGKSYAQNFLRVTFFDSFGRNLGTTTTKPVSSVDRSNKTILIFRSQEAAIPIGTRRIEVRWEIKNGGNAPLAFADNLKVLLYDSRKGKFKYPGSGKDLNLFTGVDSRPTGGVGFDVKKGTGGKILNVRIKSVMGTYNKEVILLLGQFFPTGKPPKPLGPPLTVGIGFGFILNGYSMGGPIGPIRLLPDGSDFSFLLPSIPKGTSLMLQGGVFTTKAPPPFPIIMTNGHEIQF